LRAWRCASATPASADTITISGQVGAGVSADQLAAPDGLWALSFDVGSNPAAEMIRSMRNALTLVFLECASYFLGRKPGEGTHTSL